MDHEWCHHLAIAGTLGIALFAGTLFDLSERAAIELIDARPYVEAVWP
ncbi:MAG: hypothetical protein R2710_00490 [Acidimicrobiales bacterium]